MSDRSMGRRPGLTGVRTWEWVIGATMLVAVVTAVAVRATGPDEARPVYPVVVEHVHGLGVDPADGALYAATHYGLFRVGAEDVSQVGDRHQDTMGFTVLGPNHFLGSGHPDLREALPPRLGLIESTDGGRSWEPVSLSGRADFHALAVVDGTVFGYDASTGRLMTSTDRRRWETRSTLDLVSFAVNPAAPNQLSATTRGGGLRSSDGGRTWSRLDGPTLALVAWDDRGGLWGLGPSGVVSRSGDGGDGWVERGRLPGSPEAVVATDGRLYAATNRGIHESTDGGRTWRTRYEAPA